MILTSSHQKGGVGKSTLLWNLAIEISKKRKVTVIDLDMQKTFTQSYKLRLKKKEETSELHDNIEMVEVKDKESLINVMKYIKEEDLLFIDSGGFDSVMNRIVIMASNVLLTPVSSKFYELLGLREYEKIIRDISKDIEKKIIATIVFNKINPNTKHLKDIYKYVKESEYFNYTRTVLRQRVDYENSPSVGMSVLEFSPKSKTAEEFLSFKKEIDTIIGLK